MEREVDQSPGPTPSAASFKLSMRRIVAAGVSAYQVHDECVRSSGMLHRATPDRRTQRSSITSYVSGSGRQKSCWPEASASRRWRRSRRSIRPSLLASWCESTSGSGVRPMSRRQASCGTCSRCCWTSGMMKMRCRRCC